MANTKARSKTTKKKGSIFSKINFGSTKTRILVTILAFGVIGGGLTVYKSFAANSVTVGGGTIDPTPVVETKVSTGKSNQKVARINPGESLPFWIAGSLIGTSRQRFCVTARYENPSASSKPASITLSVTRQLSNPPNLTAWLVTKADRTVSSAESYTTHCTDAYNGWGVVKDPATIAIKNNGPSTVRVGVFLIELL